MTSATDSRQYRSGVTKRGGTTSSDAILSAARELLAAEGTAALTVRRIATAAGGSTMNVYSRFGGKDGVIDALLIEGFELLADTIGEGQTSDDPLDDLHHCSRAYRRFALANRAYYELMFDRTIPDFTPSAEGIVAAKRALGTLATRVQRAMDAGKLRSGDPVFVATMFWAACHGPVSLELRGVGPPETNWAAVGDGVIDGLIDGLRAR